MSTATANLEDVDTDIDTSVHEAAQTLIDRHQEGTPVYIEAFAVPQEALETISEEMKRLGVDCALTDKLTEALKEYIISKGRDFASIASTQEMFIVAEVADSMPACRFEDGMIELAAIDGTSATIRGVSQVELQNTINGTSMTSNRADINKVFSSVKGKKLWIRFESPTKKELDGLAQEQGAALVAVAQAEPAIPQTAAPAEVKTPVAEAAASTPTPAEVKAPAAEAAKPAEVKAALTSQAPAPASTQAPATPAAPQVTTASPNAAAPVAAATVAAPAVAAPATPVAPQAAAVAPSAVAPVISAAAPSAPAAPTAVSSAPAVAAPDSPQAATITPTAATPAAAEPQAATTSASAPVFSAPAVATPAAPQAPQATAVAAPAAPASPNAAAPATPAATMPTVTAAAPQAPTVVSGAAAPQVTTPAAAASATAPAAITPVAKTATPATPSAPERSGGSAPSLSVPVPAANMNSPTPTSIVPTPVRSMATAAVTAFMAVQSPMTVSAAAPAPAQAAPIVQVVSNNPAARSVPAAPSTAPATIAPPVAEAVKAPATEGAKQATPFNVQTLKVVEVAPSAPTAPKVVSNPETKFKLEGKPAEFSVTSGTQGPPGQIMVSAASSPATPSAPVVKNESGPTTILAKSEPLISVAPIEPVKPINEAPITVAPVVVEAPKLDPKDLKLSPVFKAACDGNCGTCANAASCKAGGATKDDVKKFAAKYKM